MIDGILPIEVVCIATAGDDSSAFLLPEEAAQFGWAVEKRVKEFTISRTCARRALQKLGLPAVPILRGSHGEPVWPAGVVGSITHCDGYCAAAVALTSDVLAIGIDAEVHAALPLDVLQQVCFDDELLWLKQSPPDLHWDCLMFSIKEAIFKAWFPLTGRWLGFEDVQITFNPEQETFHARLLQGLLVLTDRTLTGFSGRYAVRHGLALSAVVVMCK
jgi:4'-phosphopantetheinyl transferase EntD